MEGHAKKCVERYCELANKTTEPLYKVSTPYIDDHQFKEEELKSMGKLPDVCSQIVLKCLYLARLGGLDILWSVNKLARAITKWTRACDKRLARLISYIHHTSEYKQYCNVGKYCTTMSIRSISRCSTEVEFISLDAGLQIHKIPALDLWDLVVEVLHSDSNRKQKLKPESHVHFVPSSNAKYSHEGTKLYIFEDNESVIKMIMKGRSPNLRHVS